MKNFLFCALLFSTIKIFAQLPPDHYHWSVALVSNYNTLTSSCKSMAIDNNNNTYLAGIYANTINLTYGAGNDSMSVPGFSMFVVKYDSVGNYVWAFSVPTGSEDAEIQIVTDNAGYIYLTGHFTGQVDFDPGADTNTITSYFDRDIFFAKYDVNSNYVWAKSLDGWGTEKGGAIALDRQGNIFIGGFIEDTMDYDPGPGTAFIPIAGGANAFFIAKYDNTGNYLWAKVIRNGSYTPPLNKLITDSAGNLYAAGTCTSGTDFSGGLNTAIVYTNSSTDDGYVAKYDGNGNCLWAKGWGGSDYDRGNSVAVDSRGNVYTIGNYHYILNNLDRICFTKYNTNGVYQWQKLLAGDNCHGNDIIVDKEDNFYITGDANNDTNFDFSGWANGNNIPAYGYITKYDSSLNFIYMQTFDGHTPPEGGYGRSISLGPDNSIRVLGKFNSAIRFTFYGPIIHTYPTSSGWGPFFLTRYNQTPCGSTPFTSTLNASICQGSYFSFNGLHLDSAGTYTSVFTTLDGCDSIVTLHLTVNPLPNVSFNLPDSVCKNASPLILSGSPPGGVFKNGGSIVGNIFPLSLISLGQYTFNYTYTDSNQCNASASDSIIIYYCPDTTCHADYVLYPDPNTPHNWFAVNQATGQGSLTYTWNWGDGNSSTGAIVSHTYSIPAYYNICLTVSDTTGCSSTFCDSSTFIFKTEQLMITINAVFQLPTAVAELLNGDDIIITPNPASNSLIVSNVAHYTSIVITNLIGEVVIKDGADSQRKEIDVSRLPAGMYFLNRKKFVKE